MSRIGNNPISVPAGVDVKIDGNYVEVKGKNGTLSQTLPQEISVTRDGDEIKFTRPSNTPDMRGLHGLTRTLVWNMIEGVTEGYKKDLEIQGVGYRAEKKGKDLVMNLGFSHPVIITEPEGITIDVPAATKISVSGADKQKVGHIAAIIRSKRPPEPYKGKGIRYVGEYVIRKEGKAGKV